MGRALTNPQQVEGMGAIEKEIKTMLEFKVIEESQRDWRSLFVLVPKPDGSLCLCVDFRKVNSVSKCNAYPMPQAMP